MDYEKLNKLLKKQLYKKENSSNTTDKMSNVNSIKEYDKLDLGEKQDRREKSLYEMEKRIIEELHEMKEELHEMKEELHEMESKISKELKRIEEDLNDLKYEVNKIQSWPIFNCEKKRKKPNLAIGGILGARRDPTGTFGRW